nr:MAG TPA: hypothetical protein [Caudoviricetes sp.]
MCYFCTCIIYIKACIINKILLEPAKYGLMVIVTHGYK